MEDINLSKKYQIMRFLLGARITLNALEILCICFRWEVESIMSPI